MRHTPCGCCPPAAPQARDAFGDHIFSLLREKIWKKRTLENEIALTRGKTIRSVVRIVVTPPVKERPSGDRRIGFPHRTL